LGNNKFSMGGQIPNQIFTFILISYSLLTNIILGKPKTLTEIVRFPLSHLNHFGVFTLIKVVSDQINVVKYNTRK